MTTATGGTVTDSAGYRLHTFTSSADLVVSVGGPVDYVLVGGGGGGGRSNALGTTSGGGGGGAVKTGTPTLSAGTLPVVIGGGGAGAQTDGTTLNGTTGTASTFNGVTAGGGGGGGRNNASGTSAIDSGGGGGGGGGPTLGVNNPGGSSTGGFAGGAGFSSGTVGDRAGGGGGGAGAVGVAAAVNVGGNGGAGTSNSLSGAALTYGAGGGGSAGTGDTRGAAGGTGAGAGMLQGESGYPNATANTGAGGGGGGGQNGAGGGNGGSGFAIVRYVGPLTVTDAGDELYLNGDSVSITGTNFLAAQGAGAVKISPTDNVADGSAVAQTVTGWADTAITITVVAGALTKGVTLYLFVTNNLGASNASGRPVVLVATPVTVTDAGDELFTDGEAFTITGTLFMATQGAGRVVISPADNIADGGAVTQTVNTWANTSIAATAVKGGLPEGVPLWLFVENQHGVSNAAGHAVQFLASPLTVTDAGDELFNNGDAVTLTGTNFLAAQGAGFVVISPADDIDHIGAVTQTVNSWSNTSIAITVVKGALSGAVPLYLFVENNQGTSNASGWPVQFYVPAPTITNADDELFDNGDALIVTGTNFIPTQGAGKVYISPSDDVNDLGRVQQTVTVWGDTSIGILAVQGMLAEAPAPLYLFVVTNQGLSNAAGYAVQFTAAPVPPEPGALGWDWIEGIGWVELIEQ